MAESVAMETAELRAEARPGPGLERLLVAEDEVEVSLEAEVQHLRIAPRYGKQMFEIGGKIARC
jgi:hypothetical protein